ncbi:MAG: NAD(P)-binding protein [Vicinamibacterales bacterium]
MSNSDRDLGMDRDITRRDFLNGVAIGVAGSMVAPALLQAAAAEQAAQGAESSAGYYPPGLTGMRGSHPGSFEVAHQMRDARGWKTSATDTGEAYDLVIVGGGISGLAAAQFFREAVGPRASILVLDNHDDFGGHAKRNEFQLDGRVFMLNGGTLNIEAPKQYSGVSMGLLRRLGIDIERFERETEEDRGIYRRMGLRSGVFFPKERFGTDRLVVGTPGGAQATDDAWAGFLAKAPLPAEAKKDIARLQSRNQPDYMAGLSDEEKKRQLLHMSYQDFLLKVAKVHPDAAWFYQTRTTGLFLMQTDAVPAYYGWNSGYPGFQGMKLEPTPREQLVYEPGGQHGRENQERASEGGRSIHFPDGNATIARLLIRALLPDAVPGRTQEDVVTARVDYSKLDRAGSSTRVRLNSTVVQVRHLGEPTSAREVEIAYVKGGQTRSVRAGHCVMACWNSVIPYMCPELPQAQRQALLYGIKAPIVYTNVFIRNWTSFAKLGVANITAPSGYHPSVQLPEPVSIGKHQCSRTPDEPTVLHLVRTPCAPGKPRKEQHRLGRAELLATSFETFEREIRDQLARTLADGGFDPARDIAGITVNRWPHGYTYNYNTLEDPVAWALSSPEDRAFVVGRQKFGRISIANADAAGSSHTDAAIDMAHRAIREVVESRTAAAIAALSKS